MTPTPKARCATGPASDERDITHLFAGTDWAAAEGRELVSLVLMSEEGKSPALIRVYRATAQPSEGYAHWCTRCWVEGYSDVSHRHIGGRQGAPWQFFAAPSVIADYANDLRLSRHVVAGFEFPELKAQGRGAVSQLIPTRG